MKALVWHGRNDVRVEQVPDPTIVNPRDAILRVTKAAICGSDLHLLHGYMPGMRAGDILGHEFIGDVVEVGAGNSRLQVGDRVVVPCTIACGGCFFCERGLWALCDNSNPNAAMADKLWGHAPAGMFGSSQLAGGYAGGQAEYVRVPYADVGPVKIPEGLDEERALLLSDVLPAGYQAAEACDIKPGDIVAVWGCGPLGQMAILSAVLLGAGRVIAIDNVPERLEMARDHSGADVIDYRVHDVFDTLNGLTGGRGPDACIDAVGLESHGAGFDAYMDRAKTSMLLATDRPSVLREAIHACRKGGVISIAGVYGGVLDGLPLGAAFQKGLTLRMGPTHVMRYMPLLLERIERGDIDPSFVITHRFPLDRAREAYDLFNRKEDGCIKVVLEPQVASPAAGDETSRAATVPPASPSA